MYNIRSIQTIHAIRPKNASLIKDRFTSGVIQTSQLNQNSVLSIDWRRKKAESILLIEELSYFLISYYLVQNNILQQIFTVYL